jgi:hypothetical protein
VGNDRKEAFAMNDVWSVTLKAAWSEIGVAEALEDLGSDTLAYDLLESLANKGTSESDAAKTAALGWFVGSADTNEEEAEDAEPAFALEAGGKSLEDGDWTKAEPSNFAESSEVDRGVTAGSA